MKKHILKNTLTTALVSLWMILSFTACTSSERIPESEFPQAILGEWMGTVGDLKESISFKDNGTFNAQMRPTGFLSNTLSEGQGHTGTISGTWLIQGNMITLKITGTKNEQVLNSGTTSTILEFREKEILLKDEKGETTRFSRETSL